MDFSAPVKLYWKFAGNPTISKGMDSIQVSFTEETTVQFGVRSYHKKPAGTITTTDDPEDIITAVNALSSSLKTTSCERSYPTLRGYPPRIKLGESVDLPAGIEPKNTGIDIVIPPDFSYIYGVSTLAFYLGAKIVVGDNPRITTGSFEYDLSRGDWFEDEVAEVLKQTLFLDCIVRTEGIYQVDSYERSQVEADLPFDVAEMYDRPLPAQLESYLRIDFDTIEPYLPRWPLTAHLPSEPTSIEAIPHIVNELGVVREPRANSTSISRNVETVKSEGVRSTARSDSSSKVSMSVVEPIRLGESIEHAWFADGIPLGASKASVESFENQLRNVERNESIDITVVCNDPEMLDEQMSLDGVYGDREDQPYSVDSYFGVSKDQLQYLLTEDGCDFLHYIGHATPTGLRCPDGELDVRRLDSVSVDVFLLNACRSFEQAEALVELGSFGGVATLGDVVNTHAIDIGQAIAHLLNLGFPLRATVELVHQYTQMGSQYLIVGDGSLDIVQPETGAPMVCHIDSTAVDDEYEIVLDLFPTKKFQLGSSVTPDLDFIDQHFIHPGGLPPFRIKQQQLNDYLTWSMYPFELEGRLHWNNTLGTVNLSE